MPIFTFSPEIGPSPGTSTRRNIKLFEAEFGDGYTQATPVGLNHIQKEISLKWDGLTLPQVQYIDSFLEFHAGYKTFSYQPMGYSAPVNWRCKDWSISAGAPFTVTAKFEQSFVLGADVTFASLNFLTTTYSVLSTSTGLTGIVNYSRNSTATFVGSNGLIQTAAVNTPRIDQNGLLLEPGATNLAIRSQEFDNASWVKTQTTVTANAGVAPDGTTTADRLVPSTTNAAHTAVLSIASLVSGQSYSASCFFKADGYQWARLSLATTFGASHAYIDLSTGAIGLSSGFTSVVATSFGNGWWRLSVTGTATSSGTGALQVHVMNANSLTTFAGNGTSGILAWGAQFEAGTVATSYIPTTTTSVIRAADVITFKNAYQDIDIDMVDRNGVRTILKNQDTAIGYWPSQLTTGARRIDIYPTTDFLA